MYNILFKNITLNLKYIFNIPETLLLFMCVQVMKTCMKVTCSLLKISLSQMLLVRITPSVTSRYLLSTARFSSHFFRGVWAPLWTWWVRGR